MTLKTWKTHGLFQTSPTLNQKARPFWLWNGLCLLAAGVGLGVLSLLLAYGTYPNALLGHYLKTPLLALLNLLPAILLLYLLWFLLRRPWLAFLLSSLTVLGFSLANYYMLRFRDDPLMFTDLTNIREAGAITTKADYDLTPDARIWLCLIGAVLITVLLAAFVRGRPRGRTRLIGALMTIALCVPLSAAYTGDRLYNRLNANDTGIINQWSATQQYISRGFLYPFLHSITAGAIRPPEHYDETAAAEILAQCEDADIPEEKKVDVISIQLEAFTDLSQLCGAEDIEGIDWEKVYGVYHDIEKESFTGNLVTNIFAGGTVDTERAFLTGYADQWNYRSNVNSTAWYLQNQGYTVEGSHPGCGWFYNRQNINPYLGVPTYYFYENRFNELWENSMAPDSILLPEIFHLYEENRDGGGKPYFSFNVTYQGHGPYDTESVWRGGSYTDGRYTTETTNILDNYFGSLADTAQELRKLMDQLAGEDRPVVLIAFGDHKPWLGDANSVYKELGVNLDTSTQEGFLNYFSTRYFIWANDAAKEALDCDFVGEGPDTSSCFLMNLLFDQLGWPGDTWTQATDPIWKELPVLTDMGFYYQGDQFTQEPTGTAAEALKQYWDLSYYDGTHFRYGDQP